MKKYIIVDKDKKGNQIGQRYTITYQIKDCGTDKYKLDLYCFKQDDDGNYYYCFIAGKDDYGVTTNEERDEFLKEFYKFQKGGSYRKSNPVQMSEVDILKAELDRNNEEHRNLERKIREAENAERKKKFATYYDDVDLNGAMSFASEFKSLANKDSRYCLADIELNIWYGYKFYIYDKQLKKKVLVVTIKDGNVDYRQLSEDEI